jgi:hypothetical protein
LENVLWCCTAHPKDLRVDGKSESWDQLGFSSPGPTFEHVELTPTHNYHLQVNWWFNSELHFLGSLDLVEAASFSWVALAAATAAGSSGGPGKQGMATRCISNFF